MRSHKKILIFFLLLSTLGLFANVPQWWADKQVIAGATEAEQSTPTAIADNYEPALLGQLKFMAFQAYKTMEEKTPGSAGPELSSIINGFSTFEESPDDNYAPLLLGQLKAIALPFYTRFNAEGYDVNGEKAYSLTLDQNLADTVTDANGLPTVAETPRELLIAKNSTSLFIRFAETPETPTTFIIDINDPSITALLDFLNDASIAWDITSITGPQKNGLMGLVLQATGYPADIIAYNSPDYLYPWPDPASASMNDNYEAANLGQLKYLFSFDLAQWLPRMEITINKPDHQSTVDTAEVSIDGILNTFGWDATIALNDNTPIALTTPDSPLTEISIPVAGADPNPVFVHESPSFSFNYLLPQEGANVINITGLDLRNNTVTESFTVNRFSTPPTLLIDQPNDDFYTNANTISISGNTDADSLTLTIVQDSTTLTPTIDLDNGDYFFTQDLSSFSDGGITLTFVATATSPTDNTVSVTTTLTRTIVRDTLSPSVAVTSPANNLYTNQNNTTIEGTTTNADFLSVNGQAATINPDGSFDQSVFLLEGSNIINVVASDLAGNTQSTNLTINLDITPPSVSYSPQPSNDPITVNKNTTTQNFSGTVGTGNTDSTNTTVFINGEEVTIIANDNGDGTYDYTYNYDYTINDGLNEVAIVVTDEAGNSTTENFTIFKDIDLPSITFFSPLQNAAVNTSTINIQGRVDDINATVSLDGATVPVDANGDFTVQKQGLSIGLNSIEFIVEDEAGNNVTETLDITLDQQAPQLNSLAAANVDNTNTYSFDGTNTTYVPLTEIHLNGIVDEANCIVTILGGQVPTFAQADADGAFDFATTTAVIIEENEINTLQIIVTDPAGNTSTPVLYTVVSDTIVPQLTLTTPDEALSSLVSPLFLSGQINETNLQENGQLEVKLNTTTVATIDIFEAGQFSDIISLAAGSGSILTFHYTDAAGNVLDYTYSDDLTITVPGGSDTTPPYITLLTPQENALISTTTIDATIKIDDVSNLSSIYINGDTANNRVGSLVNDTLSLTSITLTPNASLYQFTIEATDDNALTTSKTFTFTLDSTTPNTPTLAANSIPAISNQDSVTIIGSADANTSVTVSGGLYDVQVTATSDGDFTVLAPLQKNQPNTFTATAVGANGSSSAASNVVTVTHDDIAPLLLSVDWETATVDSQSIEVIAATFNEAINAATGSNITITLDGASFSFSTTVNSGSEEKLLFYPGNATYPTDSEFVVNIPNDIQDFAGNALGTTQSFTLTSTDTIEPNAPDLDEQPEFTNQASIAITGVSEPFASITVNDVTANSVDADSEGAFSISQSLSNGANILQVKATDEAGNVSPAASLTITYDDTLPIALTTFGTPLDPATQQTFSILFQRTNGADVLDASSLNGVLIIDADNNIVPSSVTINDVSDVTLDITLASGVTLDYGSSYEILLPSTLAEVSGNTLGAAQRIPFTTQSAPLSAPIIRNMTAATRVKTSTIAVVLFGEPGFFIETEVTVDANPNSVYSAEIPNDGEITLSVTLTEDKENEIKFRVVDDTTSLGLTSPYTASRVITYETTSPTIIATNVATDVDFSNPLDITVTDFAVNDAISLTFSEMIDAEALEAAIPSIRVLDEDDLPVPGVFKLPTVPVDVETDYIVRFEPTRNLAPVSTYKLIVDTNLRDLAGNPLASAVEQLFTTDELPDNTIIPAPIFDPLESTTTTETSITLTGEALPDSTLHITGGAQQAGDDTITTTVSSNGRFVITVPLNIDRFNILTAFVSIGLPSDQRISDTASIAIDQKTSTSGITILSPQEGLIYGNVSMLVFGTIENVETLESITLKRGGEATSDTATLFGNYFARQVIFDDYTISTHKDVSDLSGITASPRHLAIARLASGLLHFRFYDEAQEIAFEYNETMSDPKKWDINALETDLTEADSNWDISALSLASRYALISRVQAITGYIINEPDRTITITALYSDGTVEEETVTFDLEIQAPYQEPEPTVATVTLIRNDADSLMQLTIDDSSGSPAVYNEIVSDPEAISIDQIEAILDAIDDDAVNGTWDVSSLNVEDQRAFIVRIATLTGFVIDDNNESIINESTYTDDGTDERVVFDIDVYPAFTEDNAPIAKIVYPQPGEFIKEPFFEAMVVVEEGNQLSYVELNSVTAHQTIGNLFFIYGELTTPGVNTLSVQAIDAFGNAGEDNIDVFYDGVAPSAPTGIVANVLNTTTALDTTSKINDRVITLAGNAEAGSIVVVENALNPVRFTVPANGAFSITVPLNDNTTNNLIVYTTDLAGNRSVSEEVVIIHDDTAPYVIATIPTHQQVGVQENSDIFITFSEPIDGNTLYELNGDANIIVTSFLDAGEVEGNLILSADGRTVTFVPRFKLNRSDTITVDITTNIEDANNIAMESPQSISFDTAVHRTIFTGIVVDENLRPIPNILVGIQNTDIFQYTTSFGTFILDEVPLGEQILYVDGRPDPATGLAPQGDNREFNYLEFPQLILENADNTLGRPIFMVPTDYTTLQSVTASGGDVIFASDNKALSEFKLTIPSGSVRFEDGSNSGALTVTKVEAPHIPARLPSGAIPHYLVEIGPDNLTLDQPASITVDDNGVYELKSNTDPALREVIFFHFKYGMADYKEIGRAVVSDVDGTVFLDAADPNNAGLTESGFVGYIPADPSYDLTRTYLQGRVVDGSGNPIPGIAVNAIAGSTTVVTDDNGEYTIPMPDIRLFEISTYASVPTDQGNPDGESPFIVFQSPSIRPQPSGVTRMEDIVVNSFVLFGHINFLKNNAVKIPTAGLLNFTLGELDQLDEPTVKGTQIFVYRNISSDPENPVFDSVPYATALADQDPDATASDFDAKYVLTFLGSRFVDDDVDAQSQSDGSSNIPQPGDIVKIVAFEPTTGFYGEVNHTITAVGAGQQVSLDTQVDISLRAPIVDMDLNRVFFIDGIRLRANIGHNGVAFTNDEFIECKTSWRTVDAIPLDREELSMSGRLRVNSIEFNKDYFFSLRGGEQFNVLEIRESLFTARLEVLQQNTDVGKETFSISPNGSFRSASLIPVNIQNTYGSFESILSGPYQEVPIQIVELEFLPNADGDIVASGRVGPGTNIDIDGASVDPDQDGFFSKELSGAIGTGGIDVTFGGTTTKFGSSATPVIYDLDPVTDPGTALGLVPSTGSQGDLITINGENFSAVPVDNRVSFNGAPAIVHTATQDKLEVYVPNEASSGPVTVTVAGKISNGVSFDFISKGINNGSFEVGYFRGFTVEGSGRVVTHSGSLQPTHGSPTQQFMAHVHTGDDPSGFSSITTDKFTVSSQTPYVAFDFNILGTNVSQPLHTYLQFYIIDDAGNETFVPDAIPEVQSLTYSAISGYNQGSGFRTAVVPVPVTEGSSVTSSIQVKIVLLGRGLLRSYPGILIDDDNPYDMSKRQGTSVLLDNFRLVSSVPPSPPAVVFDSLDMPTYSFLDSSNSVLKIKTSSLPAEADTIFVYEEQTGRIVTGVPDGNGNIELMLTNIKSYAPFDDVDPTFNATGYFHIGYSTANDAPAGAQYSNRVFSSVTEFKIDHDNTNVELITPPAP